MKPAHFDDPKVLLEVDEEAAWAMKGLTFYAPDEHPRSTSPTIAEVVVVRAGFGWRCAFSAAIQAPILTGFSR